MAEEEQNIEQYQLPVSVGDKLRNAREAKGMSLAQLAAETRINQRHLAMIEAGDFASLPARTYAVGFSRTYAKVVGLDHDEIAREVRAELAMIAPREHRASTFEPGDPMRVPSARLAWISAIVALVVFGAGAVFLWRSIVAPEPSLPWLTDQQTVTSTEAAASIGGAAVIPPPTGEVVFTAQESGLWVKFYDQNGRQLMQKQMAAGETYVVPANAAGPQLWTGRPDALTITVGGREIPRLAEREQIMRDVPVSAEALLARPQAPAATASPTI